MIYRQLGRTGLNVSRLGFGAMRLPMIGQGKDARVDDAKAQDLMHHAFGMGVNYLDTAIFYCNNDSQRAVGVALKAWRQSPHGPAHPIIVSTKNHYKETDERTWWANLEQSLELLGLAKIDVYNVHGINQKVWAEVIQPHTSKWLIKARDQGLIGHICTSFHDNNLGLRTIVASGLFAAITLQYNMLDRQLEDGIAHAHANGVGVTVMGPLAGGRLGGDNEALKAQAAGSQNVSELALRFVLSNPAVTLAISGMQSKAIIEANAAIASDESAMTAGQRQGVVEHLGRLKELADLYCTGCGYCAGCPQKVRIGRIFRTFNLARVYGLWEWARKDYRSIIGDVWDKEANDASGCNQCGQCEEKCPQKLPIRKQLAEAHKALTGV